jgi:PRTRC genetic system protein E
MNFFSQISELIPEGVDLNITVRRSGNRLIVSVIPKSNSLKDEAQNRLAPLVVTGTTDELNDGFIEAISNPIKQATGLLVNMSDFEKAEKEAEANSKAAKAEKAKKPADKKEAPVVKKPEVNQNSLFDNLDNVDTSENNVDTSDDITDVYFEENENEGEDE